MLLSSVLLCWVSFLPFGFALPFFPLSSCLYGFTAVVLRWSSAAVTLLPGCYFALWQLLCSLFLSPLAITLHPGCFFAPCYFPQFLQLECCGWAGYYIILPSEALEIHPQHKELVLTIVYQLRGSTSGSFLIFPIPCVPPHYTVPIVVCFQSQHRMTGKRSWILLVQMTPSLSLFLSPVFLTSLPSPPVPLIIPQLLEALTLHWYTSLKISELKYSVVIRWETW